MSEFPQADGLIYLNHAAVAPWPQRTHTAVSAFAAENVRYGASRYPQHFSRKQAELRQQLKTLINAPSVDDIALLKSTSEAISVVAAGLDWQTGDNVVSVDEEFPSNRIPWEAQARHGVTLRAVKLHRPAPEQALIEACDERTRILAVSAVQYASGIRLNLAPLGRYCRAHGILFCVDAIQALGALPFDVQKVQADFVMADGHKWMLGPEGIALFYCRAALRPRLRLHQHGWHMIEDAGNYERKDWTPAANARRFECGSANMLGIHALSASLSLLLETGMETVEQQLRRNIDILYAALSALNKVRIVTSADAQQRAGILLFQLEGANDADHQALHKALLARHIISACRGGGIRFSPHFYNTEEQLRRAVAAVAELIA